MGVLFLGRPVYTSTLLETGGWIKIQVELRRRNQTRTISQFLLGVEGFELWWCVLRNNEWFESQWWLKSQGGMLCVFALLHTYMSDRFPQISRYVFDVSASKIWGWDWQQHFASMNPTRKWFDHHSSLYPKNHGISKLVEIREIDSNPSIGSNDS